MLSFLNITNIVVSVLFTLLYGYQLVYVFVSLLKKKRKFSTDTFSRFAIFIAARNEHLVIAQLIESIKLQKYPSELYDIYVIADNCTDNTAEVARNAGATVFERNDETLKGKGCALDFGFKKLVENGTFSNYDGFFVFDADNLLDENYIAEMNAVFNSGYKIVTSCRNSKNYDTNWISAGSSLWFLREAKYVNGARMRLGVSCAISGTGFLVSRDIIEKDNGWKYNLLTEDIEFTIDNVIDKEIIGYAEDAMFYDEQPYKFKDSWNQRIRWTKGLIQIFVTYGKKLFCSIFKNKSFSSFDMLMTVVPAIMLTCVGAIINTSFFIYSLFNLPEANDILLTSGISLFMTFFGLCMCLFFFGAVTTISEWKIINTKSSKKIKYIFTFPLFILTYIPLTVAAFFKKIEWTPIVHDVTKSIHEFQK